MAGGPDLFVICKNCQAEVSPYITECPYCGHRLRKRAPKIERPGEQRAPRASKLPRGGRGSRRAAPRVPRPRAHDPAGPRRLWGTLAIVVGSLLVTLVAHTRLLPPEDVVVGPDADPWRVATAPFVYVGQGATGYELIALGAAFLFGWLLERRHGLWAPLLVFLAGAVGGMAAVDAADPGALAAGGNGGALALLAAWAVRDALARRRGEEVDSDGLGLLVLAVLLIMLPAAAETAHWLAGAAGGLVGLLLGLPLARLRAA